MLVRLVGKKQPLSWNSDLLVGQKKPLQPKHVGPKRWTVGDGSFRRPTRTSSQHHISSARVFQQNPPKAVVLIGATALIVMCGVMPPRGERRGFLDRDQAPRTRGVEC